MGRWLTCVAMVCCFIARMGSLQRHFFATYMLAIYVLNQGMLFVSPATEDDDLAKLPTGGEYRPFVRALSEFRLWVRCALAVVCAFTATLFDDIDLDVDGRLLALFFFFIFLYTMKQQIVHMVRHG